MHNNDANACAKQMPSLKRLIGFTFPCIVPWVLAIFMYDVGHNMVRKMAIIYTSCGYDGTRPSMIQFEITVNQLEDAEKNG